MDEIASESALEQAYAWLCERRQDYSPNDDVWNVRWRWEEIRPQLQAQLRAGGYRLSSVRRFHLSDDDIEVWSALDALVLKATALVLAAHCLPNLSHHCHHLQGRGGAKAAVRFVNDHLADNTFVFRTDVKSYYASIDHDILLGLLEHVVADKRVLDLIRQYVRRAIYDGGLYEDVERGISLGCPLSPLMGAFYLKRLAELDGSRVRDQFPELTSLDPLDWAGAILPRPVADLRDGGLLFERQRGLLVRLTHLSRLRYVPVFLLVPSFFLFTAFADASESAWRPFCRMQIAWLTELA